MTALETQLTAALHLIGNLPLEFNGRARAIAQNSVTPPKGGWRDPFTPDQVGKMLKWTPAQINRSKEDAMAFHESAKTKAIAAETVTSSGPATVTEEPLFPVNPATYLPPAIEMIPVESSNLLGFGHDSVKTLRVWFKNGTRYDYIGLPESDFFDLVNAESAGKAYNALMKERGIKGVKL